MNKISKTKIKEQLALLLKDEEGVLTLLVGGLLISDFDEPDEAFDEGLKALNGNRAYFKQLIEKMELRLAAGKSVS